MDVGGKRLSIDTDTALFGWAAPFDVYDPELPVGVSLSGAGFSDLHVTAGCKLSTLVRHLQLLGMAKPHG